MPGRNTADVLEVFRLLDSEIFALRIFWPRTPTKSTKVRARVLESEDVRVMAGHTTGSQSGVPTIVRFYPFKA